MGGAALGLLAALVEMVVGKDGILLRRSDQIQKKPFQWDIKKGKIIIGSNCINM